MPCWPTWRSAAVKVYGWLAPGEMFRGLAMAETPPGPLIMVVQVPVDSSAADSAMRGVRAMASTAPRSRSRAAMS